MQVKHLMRGTVKAYARAAKTYWSMVEERPAGKSLRMFLRGTMDAYAALAEKYGYTIMTLKGGEIVAAREDDVIRG